VILDMQQFDLPARSLAPRSDERLAVPLPRQETGSARAASPLARIGTLEARLARSKAEIRAAQALRYRVFYEEMAAKPTPLQMLIRRDHDAWDKACDHLLAIDDSSARADRIVATYRLMTDAAARRAGMSFYSQSEFDVASLRARKPERTFLELGRSCVLAPWRSKRTIELLWAGIWNYVLSCRADVLIGCASFTGTDPETVAEQLSFLFHHAGADGDWQVAARPELALPMDRLAADAIDMRRALRALPPLIKGYLRLGAMFGRQAAIDRRFGTIDVLVILPVERINRRYLEFYGSAGERHQPS
jgi:putative hemolysin